MQDCETRNFNRVDDGIAVDRAERTMFDGLPPGFGGIPESRHPLAIFAAEF